MLDRFVSACSNVISDDVLCCGQPDKDSYSRIQVPTPIFKPEKLEVQWKSLPAKIMYEILNFPLNIETANSVITSTFEYVASHQTIRKVLRNVNISMLYWESKQTH